MRYATMAGMCGRFVSAAVRQIEDYFGQKAVKWWDSVDSITYNTAPTMAVPVLHLVDGAPTMTRMNWGFIPAWWKQEKPPTNTINARLEDAATKPMWRSAMKSCRALVPMLGYYEWQAREGKAKQPYFIFGAKEGDAAFAGLWSAWRKAEGAEPVYTFSILTMAAAPSVEEVHNRMPVILRGPKWEAWLDPAMSDGATVTAFAYEHAERDLSHYPVSTFVNSPRNQGERCIEPLPSAPGDDDSLPDE
jgi:putative SOS response-associated peptidase YedK